MEALLALKEIVIGAIPTFILVWILYFYVSRVFYRPLQAILRKRREATLGLRQTAESAVAQAEQKTTEYEQALRTARAEVYRIQERERQKAMEQRAALIQQAHQRSDEMLKGARQEIHAEAESAKKTLAGEADAIAASITRAILEPAGAPRRPEAAR